MAKNRRRFRRFKKKKGQKSLATKGYVKSIIRKESETKYNDALFQASPDYTGTLADMFAPTQGTADANQRVGDKVKLRSSRISIKMTCGDTVNFVRIILFQWYPNTNLSVPTVGTILFDISTADRAIVSPYVFDYQNQYHIIYDKVFTLATTGNNYIRTVTFKPNLKYVKKGIEFTAASVNGSNKLYMIAISDSVLDPDPSVFAYWRVFYDDS